MFNFLVSGNPDTWNGEPWVIERGRLGEYTSSIVVAQLNEFNDTAIDNLLSYPVIFASEHGNQVDARIGWLSQVRKRPRELRIEYKIEPALPVIPFRDLARLEWELDIGNWELNRTHWAVKDVDLFAELMKAGIITQAQLNTLPQFSEMSQSGQQPLAPVPINPSVFRLPDTGQEPDLVSVMMPFQESFQPVFQTLENASTSLGLRCLNANQVWNENEIIQDIFSLIYRSKIVICDFTGRNPNVFYEAGIAHTLGREVIPIVQNEEHIPFDLRHHRYINYLCNSEGLTSLLQQIAPRLQTLMER